MVIMSLPIICTVTMFTTIIAMIAIVSIVNYYHYYHYHYHCLFLTDIVISFITIIGTIPVMWAGGLKTAASMDPTYLVFRGMEFYGGSSRIKGNIWTPFGEGMKIMGLPQNFRVGTGIMGALARICTDAIWKKQLCGNGSVSRLVDWGRRRRKCGSFLT